MTKRWILLLLLVSASGFGYMILDEVMPRSVQRRTGVANLNHNQKLALEEWLNDTFVMKPAEDKTKMTQDLYISENIDNGRRLRLNDGSLWEIAPADIPTSALWLTASSLRIVPSNDPDYPCSLVNLTNNVSIKCRPVIESSNP